MKKRAIEVIFHSARLSLFAFLEKIIYNINLKKLSNRSRTYPQTTMVENIIEESKEVVRPEEVFLAARLDDPRFGNMGCPFAIKTKLQAQG